jgi:hypothetical protein
MTRRLPLSQTCTPILLALFALLVFFAAITPAAQAQTATLTPATRSLGSAVVGSLSTTSRTFTLTNTGTALLTVSSISASGDFTATSTCASVAAAASCAITVTFTPSATGARTGTLTVVDSAGTQTASLTGTGTAPITLTPTTHGFGSVAVGTTTAATTFTVKNAGTTAISGLSVTSSNALFNEATNTCTSSLAGAATCTVGVTFSPTATGAQTGSITATYTGVGSPVSATVTGTGVAPITVTPTTHGFGSVAVGTTTAATTFTVTNAGTTAISGLSVTSSNAVFNEATNTCTSSLAGAATCTVGVTFSPTATGAQTGSITAAYTGVGSPVSATVTGTGVAPITATPTTHNFGSVGEGTTSAASTFTVRNSETAAVALTISTAAPFAVTGGTCGASVLASSTCTITATFAPTAAAAQTGSITVAFAGTGSPLTLSLSGTGVSPITVTPTSRAFGSVTQGTTSAAKTFTVKNNTTAAMPLTVTSSNTEFAATGCTTSLAAAASCTLSATFAPTLTATGAQTGTIAVAYTTGSGSPQSVSVTGTAVSPLTVAPTSITFSTTRNVGTPSQPHSVTLTNGTTSAVAIGSIVASPAAYAITANTCTSSLAAAASCTVTVVFTPAVEGTTAGTLTTTYGASNSQLVVAMTGGAQVNNLLSIAVTVPTPTLAAGLTEQLTATGTYAGGTTGNLTSAAVWTTSNNKVASVSATGLVTGVGSGSATITAAVTETTGTTVTSPAAAVAVTSKTITSVTVSALAASIYPLGTDQFSATAAYSDGTSGPVTATFASSNTGVATINGTTGLATGVLSAAGGVTNITAASGSVTSAAFVLSVAGVKSISAASASPSIFPFATAQFAATLNYTDGTTGVPAAGSVTFASSNPAVATINSSSGLATGVLSAAGGATNITANMAGITPTPFALNVYGVASVTVTPANPTFPLGMASSTGAYGPTNNSVPFTATATYTDLAGTTANVTSTAAWLSSATNVATINTAGTATVTVPAGSLTTSNVSTTISATYGIAGSTLLTVQPPTLKLLSMCLGAYPSATCGTSTTSVGATLGLNATQQFSAVGSYSDGSTQNLTSLATWAASTPQEVNVNSAGLATVLATDNGAHAITASYGTIAPYVDSDTGWITASTTAAISCPSPTIDMKILVVNNAAANAGAGYADFPAIQQILNYVGTPYEVVDVSATAPALSDGACHGYFQGVIFAYGGDYYSISAWQSSLISYEQTFNVRQLNWYAVPDPNFGLGSTVEQIPSTLTETANFTPAAQPIFFYANTATPLTITNAAVDLTTVAPAAGGSVTPLLQDASNPNNIISAIYTYNGQQFLSQTFDSNPYLTHDLVLAYGLLNWVTKGVFLGDYHVYATQEIDDFFIDDSEWIPSTTCLTNLVLKDRTLPDASNLPVFRVDAADMAQLVAWQTTKQADPLLSPGTTFETGATSGKFELTIALNGVGTSGNGDWSGLTAPIIASSATGGMASFTAQDFSGLPGQSVTVTNTSNGSGVLNGTWTIVSETSSAATTPGTTTFTATPSGTTSTPPTLATATETGNPATATAVVADDLVANLQSYQSNFHWISHTYDHPSTLNGLCKSTPTGTGCGDVADTPNPVDDIDLEILTNLWTANSGGVNLDTDPSDIGLTPLTFTDFNPGNIVTPGVTGLNDPNVPTYLFEDGIKYAVSDSSVIGQPNNGPNPSPNVGIVNVYNGVDSGIYEVPRHPNDVFYNVANWADDDAEFVCIYSNYLAPTAPAGTVPAPDPPFNTYNAAQVLDFTSTAFVNNMLMGDMDPEMFHQPDLHFSDNYANLTNAAPSGTIPASVTSFLGTATTHVSSLLSDTYDLTFSKYEAVYKLPVLTPTLDQMGVLMQNRNSFNLAGVTASISAANTPQAQIIITMPAATSTSPATAIIPVTGLTSTGSEVYGGQNISHINMTPGQSITFPLP